MKKYLFSIVMILFFNSVASANCADGFAELKAVVGKEKCPPLSWVETSANDGKPMKVVLSDNPLKIEISKGGRAWVHSKIEICRESNKLLIRFTEAPTIVNRDVLPLANSSMKDDAELPLTMSLEDMSLKAGLFWKGKFKPSVPAQEECGQDD